MSNLLNRVFVGVTTIAVAGLITACGAGDEREVLAPGDPGLVSAPEWLTFTCLEPGCRDVLTATVAVEGSRSIAVKRLVLSDESRRDFTVVPTRAPPFVLSPRQTFEVEVTHAPTGDPRLGDVDLLIAYTDAAPESDPDRIPAGELAIPLMRRLVGEPMLSVEPNALNFGAVPPNSERRIPLVLRNTGTGNAGLVIAGITSDAPADLSIDRVPRDSLLPMQETTIEAIYAPTEARFIQGFITVTPVGGAARAVSVPFIGTSITEPNASVTPSDGVDFGDVPVGASSEATFTLTNGGGQALRVQDVRVVPNGLQDILTIESSLLEGPATVAPLNSVDVNLSLLSTITGPIDGQIIIRTNDPTSLEARIPVRALVTRPEIQIAPANIDFGLVPQGWTQVQPLEISNPGYGDLVITNLGFVLGSSDLFTLRSMPSLPIRLSHDQRIGLEIEFRAEAEASFNATLSIDSNDANMPFIEVNVGAEGASCEAGCPIANGQPTCAGGMCGIAQCNENWYDVDGDPSTGCECPEIGADPGGFCADSTYLGRFNDNGSQATFQGILPEDSDRDVVRFFAYDEGGFLSDAFDVRVTLETSDPGIEICVYRHQTDSHLNECFFENEVCPLDGEYRRDGSLGRDDSGDYIIRVTRDPSSPGTCAPYTLFIRNG